MGITMTLQPTFAEAGTKQPRRIAIIDDDDSYRKTLGLSLAACGFEFIGFANSEGALNFLSAGDSADLVLLEWSTPAIDGSETLRELRQRGIAVPVVVLTLSADQSCEDAALKCGALDFIDKSRRVSIILRRLQLIAQTTKRDAAAGCAPTEPGKGPLALHPKTRHAHWKGSEIYLTRTEFAVLSMLASQPGTDFTYRAIYDVVRSKGFMAGKGPNGYRANVRSFIKRIRKKIRDVDPEFDGIRNYFGFGYRWHYGPAESAFALAGAGEFRAPPSSQPLLKGRRSTPFGAPGACMTKPLRAGQALQPSDASG